MKGIEIMKWVVFENSNKLECGSVVVIGFMRFFFEVYRLVGEVDIKRFFS